MAIRRVNRVAFVALSIFCVVAPRVSAQAVPADALRAGDHVRVWATEPRLQGAVSELRTLRADSLRLKSLRNEEVTYEGLVTVVNVGRLEVERRERGFIRTVVGIVGGGILGGVVGGALGGTLECGGSCDDEWEGFGGFLLGGATGILVGGTYGGIKLGQRPAKWHPVALPAAQR